MTLQQLNDIRIWELSYDEWQHVTGDSLSSYETYLLMAYDNGLFSLNDMDISLDARWLIQLTDEFGDQPEGDKPVTSRTFSRYITR